MSDKTRPLKWKHVNLTDCHELNESFEVTHLDDARVGLAKLTIDHFWFDWFENVELNIYVHIHVQTMYFIMADAQKNLRNKDGSTALLVLYMGTIISLGSWLSLYKWHCVKTPSCVNSLITTGPSWSRDATVQRSCTVIRSTNVDTRCSCFRMPRHPVESWTQPGKPSPDAFWNSFWLRSCLNYYKIVIDIEIWLIAQRYVVGTQIAPACSHLNWTKTGLDTAYVPLLGLWPWTQTQLDSLKLSELFVEWMLNAAS